MSNKNSTSSSSSSSLILIDEKWIIKTINAHVGVHEHLQQLECKLQEEKKEKEGKEEQDLHHFILDVFTWTEEEHFQVNQSIRIVFGLNEEYQKKFEYQFGNTPYSSSSSSPAFPERLTLIQTGLLDHISSTPTTIQLRMSCHGCKVFLQLPNLSTYESILQLKPETPIYVGIERL